MNKKLKSIVMALAICVLGYTQIGCQSDNIKNENKQEVKNYSTQVDSEDKNNQNSNKVKVHKGKPGAEEHIFCPGSRLIIADFFGL